VTHNEYQEQAAGTLQGHRGDSGTILIALLGLAGETGELLTLFKKYLKYVQSLGGSSITLTRLQRISMSCERAYSSYAPIGVALLAALLLNFLRK
jgi:hypothetical protein